MILRVPLRSERDVICLLVWQTSICSWIVQSSGGGVGERRAWRNGGHFKRTARLHARLNHGKVLLCRVWKSTGKKDTPLKNNIGDIRGRCRNIKSKTTTISRIKAQEFTEPLSAGWSMTTKCLGKGTQLWWEWLTEDNTGSMNQEREY